MISKSASRLAVSAAMIGAAVAVAPGTAVAAAAPGTAYVVSGVLYFAAGAGVANYPYVGTTGDGRAYLIDTAPVRLDPGRAGDCVQAQGNEVSCGGITRIVAYLGDGNDTFSSYHNLTSVVYGQEGNDTLYGWFGNDQLYGGLGDDHLYGLPGHDTLDGEQGKDTVEGDDGSDKISGGAGDDVLSGDGGPDRISGGPGEDTVHGGADGDVLNGGGGTGIASDTGSVYGDDGDDWIVYDYSTTQLFGGAGFDTIDYSTLPRAVRVSLRDGGGDTTLPLPDHAVPWTHDAHNDNEKLIGTAYNDELTGNSGPNTIIGGAGNDQLWGSDGDDTLDAQDGTNQRIVGGTGVDTCAGNGVTYRESCEG